MNKIIGVTVGTPTSPRKMEQEIKPVKTVNGVAPDESGNVEVAGVNGGYTTLTETLRSTSWLNDGASLTSRVNYVSQTPIVTADDVVICSVIPNAEMEKEVIRCGVRCTEQGRNYLVFTAINQEKPTIDIDMNILVMR